MIIGIDHIEIIVRDVKEYVEFYQKLGFKLFISMDAVDRLELPPEEQDPRFEVVYFLKNIERNEHARLKVRVNEGQDIPTIKNVYQGADWAERFVWDFYGIVFTGGTKRRILLYEEFVGHPLRKDYPKERRQPLVRRDPNEV